MKLNLTILLLCTLEPELAWFGQDPALFFCSYRESTGQDYLYVVLDNWLELNPEAVHHAWPKGELHTRIYHDEPTSMSPLVIGNLNGDDIVNLVDFAVYAKYYRRQALTETNVVTNLEGKRL